jgi:hypothetical protein
MTEGVMVWKAAYRKVNPECTAEGSVDRTYTRVEYDAIMIGGNGGNSGCAGGGGGSDVDVGR